MKDAELILGMERDTRNCYLTRYSHTKKTYRLSVMMMHPVRPKAIFYHFAIIQVKGKERKEFQIERKEETHTSVNNLLEYYQNHPINKDGEGIGRGVLYSKRTIAATLQRNTSADASLNSKCTLVVQC